MKLHERETTKNVSDLQLVEKYKTSADKFFVGELYKRYSHLVLGVCITYFKDKDESKDGVIKIFEKLFEELKKRDIQNFKNWLTFVTKNYCISVLRKQKTEKNRKKDFLYDEPTCMESSSDLRHEQEETEFRVIVIKDAVKSLKEDQRICIELFFYKNKSYREIATETGFSVNEVKSHLQNGKRNIKNVLHEHISTQ